MKKLTPIEMSRKELELHIRHQANIARLHILNEILPTALAEFDKRISRGEPYELERPSITELVAEALKGAE